MSFEITGKLHKKFDIESKSASFQAREFVILIEEGNYPQYIKFQLTQDRCNLVDNVDQNETIKIWFDLRGREWNEKYFTNLNAWKIEKISTSDSNKAPIDSEFPSETDFEGFAGDMEDDLPF